MNELRYGRTGNRVVHDHVRTVHYYDFTRSRALNT